MQDIVGECMLVPLTSVMMETPTLKQDSELEIISYVHISQIVCESGYSFQDFRNQSTKILPVKTTKSGSNWLITILDLKVVCGHYYDHSGMDVGVGLGRIKNWITDCQGQNRTT